MAPENASPSEVGFKPTDVGARLIRIRSDEPSLLDAADAVRYTISRKETADQKKWREARAAMVELEDQLRFLLRSDNQEAARHAAAALGKAREEFRLASTPRRSGSQQVDEFDFLIREGTVLPPPLDPRRAIETIIGSDILSACIWSMAKHVGGHGYDFESIFEAGTLELLKPSVRQAAEMEKLRLRRFFKHCNQQMSFLDIRRRTTADKESLGYACWELQRNGAGNLAGITHMPAWTVRITPLSEPIDSVFRTQDDEGNWQEETIPTRWRLICQYVNGRYRYYKQLGDPRTVDNLTGAVYMPDDQRGEMIRGTPREAHETLFFSHYGVGGGINPYGSPRWTGAVMQAVGRRQASEVNLLYFDNKAVPPLAILVAGGQLTDVAAEQVKERFQQLKGREAFHDVLVLEALSGGPTDAMDAQGRNQVRMQIQSLSASMEKEGLFRLYQQDCREDVRMVFGIPSIMLGLSESYNRASAETAMEIADREVFQPEREAEDHIISQMLLPALGARYWEFRTKGLPIADEESASSVLTAGLTNGVITPDEARPILGRILGVVLNPTGKAWAQRPWAISQFLAQQGVDFTKEGAQATPGTPGAAAAPGAAPGGAPAAGGAGGAPMPTDANGSPLPTLPGAAPTPGKPHGIPPSPIVAGAQAPMRGPSNAAAEAEAAQANGAIQRAQIVDLPLGRALLVPLGDVGGSGEEAAREIVRRREIVERELARRKILVDPAKVDARRERRRKAREAALASGGGGAKDG